MYIMYFLVCCCHQGLDRAVILEAMHSAPVQCSFANKLPRADLFKHKFTVSSCLFIQIYSTI